jgi:galactose mutarotase-like enzyme
MDLTITSQRLRATIEPARGGAITGLVDSQTGEQLLVRRAPTAPPDTRSAISLEDWIDQYPGGWQTVAPNGGTACRLAGVDHGWHGEASIAPWTVVAHKPDRIALELNLRTLPVTFRREVALAGAALRITETVRDTGAAPVALMWSHHPALGGDLLADGEAALASNATYWWPDDQAEHVGPAAHVTGGSWPPVDEAAPWARIEPGLARLAYLGGFPETAWASLRRPDGRGVLLAWDATVMPAMWLWVETGGTTGWPWHGSTTVVGLEPATTTPARGLATARPEDLLVLAPGAQRTARIALHLLEAGQQPTDIDLVSGATTSTKDGVPA